MKIENFAVDMLNNLPGMVYRRLIKPPYQFTYVSEGSLELTGYTPQELMCINMSSLVYPDDVPKVKALRASTIDIGIPLENSYRIVTKDGTVKHIWLRVRVLDTDEDGMPKTVEGFAVDLTKYIRLETARLANQAKLDFLSRISLEVRTPMNIIMGMADITLREKGDNRFKETAQTIKTEGTRLVSVLDNILDFTKLESGEIEIKQDVYSFSALLKEIVSITKDRVSAAGLEFNISASSKIPEMLVGDKSRVRQILMSILDNSIKFTDVGFINLEIDAQVDYQTVNLEISVADTGHGIKEEDLPTVLQEFSQFDDKVFDGIGLGLANSNKLARLMGGEISISSVHGWGSIFNVSLPQQIFDHQAIASVGNPQNKAVVIFESRDDYKDTLVNILEDLNVSYKVVNEVEGFCTALSSGKFAFAFIASPIYDEVKMTCPITLSQKSTQIVIIKSVHESASNDDGVLIFTTPLYCLPVADILNGTYFASGNNTQLSAFAGCVHFTAPEARVLIVDDISSNLMVAEGLLAPYNVLITTAESGHAAIEAIKNTSFDLILMDYMMPVMNGAETTLAIRDLEDVATNCNDVPIIALTANISDNAQATFRTSGFNDLIPKPIDVNKLNEIMEKWIPADLQLPIEADDYQQCSTPTAPYLRIEGIDVSAGIALAGGGNFDVYISVLEKFLENGHRLVGEIQTAVAGEDLSLYEVHIHAIRSISASIGANLLSQTARVLETANEQGRLDLIRATTHKFLDDLNNMLLNIEEAIIKYAKPQQYSPKPKEDNMNDKKKILLIDDTETFLFLLNDILKGCYETLIAKDGEDGLETAEFARPDLIMLDIVMPGMSGFDVLAKLKANDELKHIPVILVSGKDSDEDRAKGHDAGAVGYILKPFRVDDVLDEVAKVLHPPYLC
ncbi:MAG: response regulator [Defluviitaleaceae bacterium]|nr:response regulator [Defluviitaleaceae bacterium]